MLVTSFSRVQNRKEPQTIQQVAGAIQHVSSFLRMVAWGLPVSSISKEFAEGAQWFGSGAGAG